MSTDQQDTQPLHDPLAEIERALLAPTWPGRSISTGCTATADTRSFADG